MFSVTFKGRFELKDPQEFLDDIQELLKKHKVEYYGKIYSENLGEYIDFQKDEEIVSDKSEEK